jgi:formylglycine-generating enzyme required for sulfatase activity
MVHLEGGEFLMGTDDQLGFPADGEGPVWEWCSDWFATTLHVDGPREDPSGQPLGQTKVKKGGSKGV